MKTMFGAHIYAAHIPAHIQLTKGIQRARIEVHIHAYGAALLPAHIVRVDDFMRVRAEPRACTHAAHTPCADRDREGYAANRR